MDTIRKLMQNFWFNIFMAMWSLIALTSACLSGSLGWVVVDIACVLYWVHCAYKINKA